jgi:hypothetical protein
MCHSLAGKQVPVMNTPCDCECACPALLPIDSEIKCLEEHRKFMQDRIEVIDRKIAALKTVKER